MKYITNINQKLARANATTDVASILLVKMMRKDARSMPRREWSEKYGRAISTYSQHRRATYTEETPRHVEVRVDSFTGDIIAHIPYQVQ